MVDLAPNGTGRLNDMAARLTATEQRLDRKLQHQDDVLDDLSGKVNQLAVDMAVVKDRLLTDEKDAARNQEDRRSAWEVKAILAAAVLSIVFSIIMTVLHIH